MNRISNAFENKKAFIPFITAGDPNLEKTEEFILEMEKAGAALVEIGIPFSDPIAEGPVIQDANIRSLSGGCTTDKIFEMVKSLRTKTDIPLVFMGYANSLYKYGYDKFCAKCQEVGIDGLIIPDIPYEEKNELAPIAEKYGMYLISMIAPTSEKRIRMIAKEAKGFIYLVSSMGVTGTRDNTSFSNNLEEIIEHIRQVTNTPVAIGFGINKPEQVKEFKQYADGVIVGSAIVNIIKEHGSQADEPLKEYIQSLTNEL